MKKFLLVIFIGLVLAMNLYGIIDKFTDDKNVEMDHVKETTTLVYME